MNSILRMLLLVFAVLSMVTSAIAHDGWIQTNIAKICLGDMVYIDMQFGNHGNTHRDYKIWGSKWDLGKATFVLHTPISGVIDIKNKVIDLGVNETKTFCGGTTTFVDKNGYLVASFLAQQRGIYLTDVRQDSVVTYAPERSIKCSKAIVAAVPSTMANYGNSLKGYDKVLGQQLEIVPLNNPTELAVGDTLTVQVLFKGDPLADACLSVIPRGKTLPPFGQPNPYDLMTDMDGKASFTFDEANYHLLNVHNYTAESGVMDGLVYTQTKYAGNLTVIVKPKK